MKGLIKKIIRDLMKNWRQFFSVFLMALLSVLVFIGLQGAWKGLDVSLKSYISSSHLADSWIQVATSTEEDLKQLKKLESVDSVASHYLLTVADGSNQISLETLDDSITVPQLVEGSKLGTLKDIWLDYDYAKENNYEIGDRLSWSYGNVTGDFVIVGFVQSADKIYYTGSQEFIAPNHAQYGYAYVSEATIEESFGNSLSKNYIELSHGVNEDLREEIESIFGSRLISYYTQDTLPSVSNALERVGQIRNLSFLFSFIFILLAVLAMYTTIKRMIDGQTMEIAVLKALGFSNLELGLHYTFYGFLVSFVGAVVGASLSPLISIFVLSTQKTMFSVPEWKLAYDWTAPILLFSVIVICSLSAYLASSKVTGGLPALYLRGGVEKRGKKLFIERFPKIWKQLAYPYRWVLRDAMVNKTRLLMAIIGVAGGMMLMIAGLGMPKSINHLVDQAYTVDFTYDRRLHVNSTTDYEDIEGVQFVQLLQAHFQPDDGYNRLLMIVSQGDFVNMRAIDGGEIKSGGLYVTEGFAKRANYQIGDSLTFTTSLSEATYELPIQGIITSQTNQGAYLLDETWEEIGGQFQPTTVLVGEGVEETDSVVSVINLSDQEKNARDFVASLGSIFRLIIAFASLLIIVVLYNLGSLSFVERSRDYATLRVLGFYNKELRTMTFIETMVTTSLGWVVGIPLGLWFLDQYVSTFSTISLEYTAYVDWTTIALASVFVLTCSLSTTLFIANRIKKLDMVSSLKGVE